MSLSIGMIAGHVAMLCWGTYFFLLSVVKEDFLKTTTISDAKTVLVYNIFMICNLFTSAFMLFFSVLKKAKVTIKEISSNKVIPLLITSCILYMIAWASVNIGIVSELVSVITTISSLYPAITAILALIFLKERLVLNQKIGIFVIFSGIIMISL
jgi:drug/metabolite transporter (DMT)-like permease